MGMKNYPRKILFAFKPTLLLLIAANVIYRLSVVQFSCLLGNSLNIAQNGDIADFFNFFMHIAVIMAVLIISLFCANLVETRYQCKISAKAKNMLFSGILDNNMAFFQEKKVSELSSALINSVGIIEQNYFSAFTSIIGACIALIISLAAILNINALILIFVLTASLLPIAVPAFTQKKMKQKMAEYSNELEIYTGCVKDYLAGRDTFKIYGSGDIIAAEHYKRGESLGIKKMKSDLYSDYIGNLITLSSFLIIIGALVFGMFLSIRGLLSVGDVFAISFISNGVSGPLSGLSGYIPRIKSVKDILDRYSSLIPDICSDEARAALPAGIEYSVRLADLSLKLDNTPILKNISYEFKKGEKYAIIGGSGSGKSTLIKTILGYYPGYTGDIFINGNVIKKGQSIFSEVSFIPQETTLFQATLRDNLTLFSQEVSDGSIYEAINQVQLTETIKLMPQGLLTQVSEDGKNFSGGEKQRIAIARALLKGIYFFILDEATSALDEQNYIKIETMLLSLPEVTIISVTHRLDKDILSMYDEILVMHNGEIVDRGSVESLIDTGKYQF